MAPKTSKDTLPKAVAEFKLLMDNKGLDMTPENIGKQEHAKERNKAMTAMKHTLKTTFEPSVLSDYDKLEAHKDRWAWLGEYVICPSSGGKSTGKKFTERTTTQKEKWLLSG